MKKLLPHATKKPLLLLGAFILCLAPGNLSAELLGVDLFAPGDRLVTRDTATGVDWLDLTATLNLSAQDILADIGGWQSLGFAHAATMDVRTLFLNSDPPNIVINTGANPLS